MWALGDYDAVATEIVADLGPILVDAAGFCAGHRVLDVAAGSGNAAIPAARTGATVVASDLTPELLDGRPAARAAAGVELTWETADAEALPFADGEFDVGPVLPGRDVRPAPPGRRRRAGPGLPARRHHRPALLDAGGLHRPDVRDHEAVRPPAAARGPAAAAVGGRGPRPSLLGDRVEQVTAEIRIAAGHRFDRPEAFRDFFKANYGPTIAVYAYIADDPEKLAALDQDLADLGRRFDRGDGPDRDGLGVPAAHRAPGRLTIATDSCRARH